MNIEEKINELGLKLPNPSTPIASYVSVMKVGNILYLSGHGPEFKDGKPVVTGKVGKDLTEEEWEFSDCQTKEIEKAFKCATDNKANVNLGNLKNSIR